MEFQPTRIIKVRGVVGGAGSEEPVAGPAWQYNLEWERTDVGKPWVRPSSRSPPPPPRPHSGIPTLPTLRSPNATNTQESQRFQHSGIPTQEAQLRLYHSFAVNPPHQGKERKKVYRLLGLIDKRAFLLLYEFAAALTACAEEATAKPGWKANNDPVYTRPLYASRRPVRNIIARWEIGDHKDLSTYHLGSGFRKGRYKRTWRGKFGSE